MAAAVWHTVELGTHKRALEEAGDQGLPLTKGTLVFANKLSSYWLQTFSMSHARMQNEPIAQWIGTCQKA